MATALNFDERERRYESLIQRQTGRAVRPYREDGYVNMLTKYGTARDSSEQYEYQSDPVIPDTDLSEMYESNGLFAKIIDTPAEEAVKHGYELDGIKDEDILSFFDEALDELDWEETAMTAVKWARLFGGSIAVMLINDGRGIEEPVDWANIESIDDIRVYDRSQIVPDYQSMYKYDPKDPFRTRGSRLGYPERYTVNSTHGSFTVHDSRVLTFRNGILPENTSNSMYQLWGIPEYLRIKRAIRDSEIAHGTAVKMLDRSVQAIYKMRDLSAELATEDGEERVLKRLQTIDMSRSLMNSITLDSEGEEYDFRTFQFSGVSDVIDSTCNYLSALTCIPQTVLFGRDPTGMNATGKSDLENYYNFVERIQKRMLRSNLRYLLSVIAQAGVATGEIPEVPRLKVIFKPLWSLSEVEQVGVDAQRAGIENTKSATVATYIQLGVISAEEVRKKLASKDEFFAETVLDDLPQEEIDTMPEPPGDGEAPAEQPAEAPDEAPVAEEQPTPEKQKTEKNPNAPGAAPEATKLPEDKDKTVAKKTVKKEQNAPEEKAEAPVKKSAETPKEKSEEDGEDVVEHNVSVFVVQSGMVLIGTRVDGIDGVFGGVAEGESEAVAACRLAREQFGITLNDLYPLCRNENTAYYLSTEFGGDVHGTGTDVNSIRFAPIGDIAVMENGLRADFVYGILKLCDILTKNKKATTEAWDEWRQANDFRFPTTDVLLSFKRYVNTMGLKPEEQRETDAIDLLYNEWLLATNDMQMSNLTDVVEPKQYVPGSVGVYVLQDGMVLVGRRNETEHGYGLLCGPGGHIEPNESSEDAARRETLEEFGIEVDELIPMGKGPSEIESGLSPDLYLCTKFRGTPHSNDGEMVDIGFRSLEELVQLSPSLYQPFKDGIVIMVDTITQPVSSPLPAETREDDSVFFQGELNTDSVDEPKQKRRRLWDRLLDWIRGRTV